MARAQAAGLRNVFVTNGYESPEALDLLAPHLDAANVDLKAASDNCSTGTSGGPLGARSGHDVACTSVASG